MLVFLSAKLLGEVNDSTYTAAALIEILHTATLIHDDVVDDSYERRGFFSINALWKSKAAVLMGDYLYAKGLLLAVNNKEYEVLNIVSDAVREMSEGELLQIKNSRKLNITEDEYYDIIRKKTATLISCCSACGAKSVGMNNETVKKMQCFGEMLGISFQIKDDLLDYQLKNSTGKPSGNDMKEKKLTLPLIFSLDHSDNKDKKKILKILNNGESNSMKLAEVKDFVIKFGGLIYAQEKMKEYSNLALIQLNEFKNGEIKNALTEFVQFTITREN